MTAEQKPTISIDEQIAWVKETVEFYDRPDIKFYDEQFGEDFRRKCAMQKAILATLEASRTPKHETAPGDKLLPCPFCDTAEHVGLYPVTVPSGKTMHQFNCHKCGLVTRAFKTEQEALVWWNTRTPKVDDIDVVDPAPLTGAEGMRSDKTAEAKSYLENNQLWDDDTWLCGQKIASKIVSDALGGDDYGAVKYGRRAITALCEVKASDAIAHAAKSVSEDIDVLANDLAEQIHAIYQHKNTQSSLCEVRNLLGLRISDFINAAKPVSDAVALVVDQIFRDAVTVQPPENGFSIVNCNYVLAREIVAQFAATIRRETLLQAIRIADPNEWCEPSERVTGNPSYDTAWEIQCAIRALNQPTKASEQPTPEAQQ